MTPTTVVSGSSQLLAALEGVQAVLGRHRPLARVRQQLLGDLAALLSGLRDVLMLDYAPGATPQQLAQALLEPVQQALPAWQGCILVLEGCCYLASSAALLQRLSRLAADPASWPAVVCFPDSSSEPQLLQQQPDGTEQLQRQLQQLHAAVAGALEQPAAVVQLGSYQGLPAMPTLNGFLLAYPVVYCVHSPQQAAAASRALSAAQLQLHRVTATCGRQLGALLAKAAPPPAGNSKAAAAVALANHQQKPSGGPHQAVVLQSFTLPLTLAAGAACETRLAATLARLRQQLEQQLQGEDVLWQGVEHVCRVVGPQAVSL